MKENEWIDIDTPPKTDRDVLVAYLERHTDALRYGVANYDPYDEEWYGESDEVNMGGLLAWLPFPEYEK